MKIRFTKMHGAGNDFIMIDDRALTFPVADTAFIEQISSRRTGVGCDGVILLQPSGRADLRMRFFNPDGGEVEMCGNGARCFARLAYELGAVQKKMSIETVAGVIRAEVVGELVQLELTAPAGLQLDVLTDEKDPVDFVNSGVPHAVVWVDDVIAVDLPVRGRALRLHERFAPQGTNANFAKVEPDGSLTVRTYERGVEAETLACGTGAVAVAVVAAHRNRVALPVTVHCASGFDLIINQDAGVTTLTGNAQTVFEGEIDYGNRI
jgi:diaminopimelate epimerase